MWFRSAVEAMFDRAIQAAMDSEPVRAAMQNAVNDVVVNLAREPRFQFIRQMALRYREVRPGLTGWQAWEHARDWLNDFLRGEKIAFGDERYDWSKAGARELADADLEYWEAA